MSSTRAAYGALALSTLAFTACFAVWMQNAVLVTHLSESGTFIFDEVETGWLLGIPVLTGSILRLPVGLLADRFGGKRVFTMVLFLGALGSALLSQAQSFWGLVVGSLGFGLAGTSFAVGIQYSSAWFPKAQQGTALGVFGAGNAGSALSTIFMPMMLAHFTHGGAEPDGWRWVPLCYSGLMLLMAGAFSLFAGVPPLKQARVPSLSQQLAVLGRVRVWRFGLYYFLFFGCFVALAQWLVPYYTSVFGTSLAAAGALAAIFSFPSGVIRALGGWLSDRFGARRIMYATLGVCAIGCFLLSVPRMQVTTAGESVIAKSGGVVTSVARDAVVVGTQRYALRGNQAVSEPGLLPTVAIQQTPAVRLGERVARKQILAKGTTTLHFAPNIAVFTLLVFAVGIAMGIGKAAVYKYIPDYFPGQVGAVGGLVGVVGGLGGFVCPILFGYLLRTTGLWTSSWAFLFVLSSACFVWLHTVVTRIERSRPRAIESDPRGHTAALVLPEAPAKTLPFQLPGATP